MDITFDLQTPDGKPAEVLAKVIEARRRELGETARQSCVAMASVILRSLRAQTKVAKENKMDLTVSLADDRYYPSFKRDKGSKKARRILRAGQDGPEVTPDRVVWVVGKYVKGESVHSYEVVDKIAENKTDKYIAVAETKKTAKNYAKERHKARVRRNKTLAKHALGLAMKAIYDKNGGENDDITQHAHGIAKQNVKATVYDSGFNAGTVNVNVHDGLDYAVPALKDGEGSVSVAITNALNKTIGYIQHRIKANGGSIDKSLKIAADEIIGAQS